MQVLQLQDRVPEHDLVELAGKYTQLKKSGKEYLGLCPFHEETKPSFFVDPENQVFYCFGCQTGGGIKTFLSKIGAPAVQEKSIQYEILRYYRYAFDNNSSRVSELLPFELTSQIVREYQIGYSDGMLYKYLSKKFSKQEIMKAGLFRESDGGVQEVFKGRLVFPVLRFGEVKGFVGYNPYEARKYLCSPGLSYSLFGFDIARRFSSESLYVVEGIKDLLALKLTGVNNVVSSLGNNLTYSSFVDIARITKKLIFAFDGDEAGLKGVDFFLQRLKHAPLEIEVIVFPDSLDPADLYSESSEALLTSLEPLSLVEYLKERGFSLDGIASILSKFPEDYIVRLINSLVEIFDLDRYTVLRTINKYRLPQEKFSFSLDEESIAASYCLTRELPFSPFLFSNFLVQKALSGESPIQESKLKFLGVSDREVAFPVLSNLLKRKLVSFLAEAYLDKKAILEVLLLYRILEELI